MIRSLEGRFATLERGGDAGRGRGFRWGALEQGGDHPMGSRGVRMGRTAYVNRVLGFSFLLDWKEAASLHGPGCPACVCVFRAILVP